MPLIQSLNTKLLLIVVFFVALSGLLIGLWQGAEEYRRLQQSYDQRLEALSERYRDRIGTAMAERQQLLVAARDSMKASLERAENEAVPLAFSLDEDPDGAHRFYLGESGVFVHRDTAIDQWTRRLVYHTNSTWLNIEPLLKSQFVAFYFISPNRVSRIWPASLVAGHRPDHDVTQEIFYTKAAPENNPERDPSWTPLYFDVYSHAWTTSLLVPLYRDDRFLGVMGADLEMAFLFEQLNQLEADFDGLEAFIFSTDGDVILQSSSPPKRPQDVSEHYELFRGSADASQEEYLLSVVNGEIESGRVHSSTFEGEGHRIIHRKMPNLDWHVSLFYPESTIADKYSDTMTVIYKNIAGMVLFLVVALFYGLKWLVTHRVLKLAQFTGRIGSDNWSLRARETGNDEISQLAQGINRMLDKINELFSGLNTSIQDMEKLAYYDQLTGLENRLLFKEQLRTALHSAMRENNHVALLYLDLDHFKDINDSLGHEAGDKLLVEVARRLCLCLREEDSVARLGGDEFAVLLRHIGEGQYASVVAGKIIETLRDPIHLGAQEVVVGTSIGITLAPDDSENIDTLMKNADLAMYQAKYQGRNIFQFYRPELNFQVEHRIRMERELRRALKKHEFELYYQPQLDVSTGQVVGVEALIRWNHPERGLIPPDHFIPIAENCGLIVPIGKWVLRNACQQARSLQKAKLKGVRVSINISARQLNDREFVSDFKAVIADSGINPECLVLEVTESTLMADADVALAHLHAIRELGIGLAIDDFGTGYSSLSYLKRLPVNCLKVDRSFVQDLPEDEEDRAITSLIVAMAASLNYQVIVEGVETEPQLRFLRRCGCNFAQGFYFHRPMPADQLMQLLFESANGTDSTDRS